MPSGRPPPALPWAVMTCAGVLTMQFVAGNAARDALYFAHLPIATLPRIIAATAAVSILLVTVSAYACRRMAPPTFVTAVLCVSAGLFIAEWALAASSAGVASQLVYVHVSSVGPMLGSGFWLIVTERFDPRTAKRRFGQIAAAGTIGGILGGMVAERVATLLDTTAMLPVLAALSLLGAVQTFGLRSADSSPAARTVDPPADLSPDRPRTGLRIVAKTPYLRHLAAFVLLGATGAVLVDYVFKAHAVAVFGRGESLLRFFAIYYAAVSVITFVIQASASRVVLERFGLAAAAGTPSAAVVVGGLAGLAVPGFPTAMFARGSQAVLRGSLFRAGYETFYTPLVVADRRAAKTIIDVGFDKLGDAAGAGIVRLAQAIGTAAPYGIVLTAAVACSASALYVATRLRRGYVSALERSLVDRAVELDLTEIQDVLTRTIAIRALPPAAVAGGGPAASPITARPDHEMRALVDLRSRDRERIVAVLRAPDGVPAALVGHVIPLLAWDALAEETARALRIGADARIGQYTDALLDADQPFAIRRRLARVCAVCGSQRAVDGLMLGLDDPRFEVRLQCGRSLSAIMGRHDGLHVDSNRALAIVEREATVSHGVWESRSMLDEVERDDAEFVDQRVTARANHSLGHVFTVLSLVLPREPLRVAFRALHADDDQLRGTALEYLELIVPMPIYERLSPFLDGPRAPDGARRAHETVLAELLRSSDSVAVNLSAMERRRLGPTATQA